MTEVKLVKTVGAWPKISDPLNVTPDKIVDMDRLLEAVKGSQMARALYGCRFWLGDPGSSSSTAIEANSNAPGHRDPTDEVNAAKTETMPPVSRPQ